MSGPTRAELDRRLAATADLGFETRGLTSAEQFARTNGHEIEEAVPPPQPAKAQRSSPLVRKPDHFSFERGIARASWTDPDVELKFDLMRLDRRSGELSAELTVLGGPELLHRARLNLAATRSRSEFSNHLTKRMAGPDWSGLLESAGWQVTEAFRQGAPAFLLRDAEEPVAAGWAMKPLLLAKDPVILFGDGGGLKSYTALATAITLQTGLVLIDGFEPARSLRVAYLDFEWNPAAHKRRMRSLCGPGQLPDILYVPCQAAGPLSHQVERLQRQFQDHRIDFAVIDSVGLATDGPPEEAASALSFFQALARLEVGSLLIAHTNRDADSSKPFGSVYWHNSARMTYFIKRERANGTSSVDVALYCRKVNDGALRADPIGLRFDFSETSTTITRRDIASMPELEAQTRLKDRMAAVLSQGAKTAAELSEQLDVPVNSIFHTARRWDGRCFVKIVGPIDGIHRIGLVA
jgi:AAA domain-containing protein